MPDYEEIAERGEDRRTKTNILNFLGGIESKWIIGAAFLLFVFIYWISIQNKTKLSLWLPALIFVGALALVGLGQGGKEIRWVHREEAEAIVYKNILEHQKDNYSDVPEGNIVITKDGGTDYDKTTWFIPWFVIDKVSAGDQRIWRIARVDCWGKGYLGSFKSKDGELPTGRESGLMYRPIELENQEFRSTR